MRTVVTGGAGFIGSTLVEALVERGDDVAVIDDLSRGRTDQVNPRASLHQLDINDGRLDELVASLRPEVVFHLAAQIDVRRSVADPLFDARVNVLGTVNVLQAAARARVARVVFASTGGAIYGDAETLPTPETYPCRPASAYGASKLAAETYGAVFEHVHGLEFVALRYGNVYGPRQDPHGEAGVVAIFAERLLARVAASINGDGRQTRDYVHVDDVVAANLRAAHTSTRPGVYNIGTGRAADVNDVYRYLAGAAGVDQPAQHGPAKPGEQMRSCLDIGRAREHLGWTPLIPLEEGLSGTLDWFAARVAGE